MQIITSLISVAKFNSLVDESFDAATQGNIEPYEERLNHYKDTWAQQSLSPGDRMRLLYRPGTGMECYLNDDLVVTIEGLDFKKAYFGMWLSENSACPDLGTKMMGN